MAASAATHINASPSSKGKAKAKDLNDHNMEEDEEEEEEEEEEMSDDEVSSLSSIFKDDTTTPRSVYHVYPDAPFY